MFCDFAWSFLIDLLQSVEIWKCPPFDIFVLQICYPSFQYLDDALLNGYLQFCGGIHIKTFKSLTKLIGMICRSVLVACNF